MNVKIFRLAISYIQIGVEKFEGNLSEPAFKIKIPPKNAMPTEVLRVCKTINETSQKL